MTTMGGRASGWMVLAGLLLVLSVRLRNGRYVPSFALAVNGVGAACLVLLCLVLDEGRFLLAMPVLINASLLLAFGGSLLRGNVPMVERFARMIDHDLSPERASHCRAVTRVWCAFFAVNGAVSLWLALFAPVHAWGLYCGGIAYLAMGALFAGEYAVRRIRFG